jgi:hypothetical protein
MYLYFPGTPRTYFPDANRLWDGLIFHRKIMIYDLQKLAINGATKKTKTKIRSYRETEIKIYIYCLQSSAYMLGSFSENTECLSPLMQECAA